MRIIQWYLVAKPSWVDFKELRDVASACHEKSFAGNKPIKVFLCVWACDLTDTQQNKCFQMFRKKMFLNISKIFTFLLMVIGGLDLYVKTMVIEEITHHTCVAVHQNISASLFLHNLKSLTIYRLELRKTYFVSCSQKLRSHQEVWTYLSGRNVGLYFMWSLEFWLC